VKEGMARRVRMCEKGQGMMKARPEKRGREEVRQGKAEKQ
jgi:hypothetical protein